LRHHTVTISSYGRHFVGVFQQASAGKHDGPGAVQYRSTVISQNNVKIQFVWIMIHNVICPPPIQITLFDVFDLCAFYDASARPQTAFLGAIWETFGNHLKSIWEPFGKHLGARG